MTIRQGDTISAEQFRASLLPPTIPEQCAREGLPAPTAEYRFHSKRRWRFDYAWPDIKIGTGQRLALEIEGGVWTQGRHTRGKGYIADMNKYSQAAISGWCVVRVTPEQVKDGYALGMLKTLLTVGASVEPPVRGGEGQ